MSSRQCQSAPDDRKLPPEGEVLAAPHTWAGLDGNGRLEILFQACLRYGQNPGADSLASLQPFYHHCLQEMPEELRMDACYALSQQINAMPTRPYQALIPFIELEIHNEVIGTASLLLVTLYPAPPQSPMAGPQWLADRMFAAAAAAGVVPIECPGVLHGLMMLKDRRLMPLWRQLWQLLNEDGRHQVLRANFHLPMAPGAPIVDFHLELLEQNLPPLLFRMVAEQLIQLAEAAGKNGVFDAEYHLPFTPEKTNRDMATVREHWDRAGYYNRHLKERLGKVAAAHPELARITEKIAVAWAKEA